MIPTPSRRFRGRPLSACGGKHSRLQRPPAKPSIDSDSDSEIPRPRAFSPRQKARHYDDQPRRPAERRHLHWTAHRICRRHGLGHPAPPLPSLQPGRFETSRRLPQLWSAPSPALLVAFAAHCLAVCCGFLFADNCAPCARPFPRDAVRRPPRSVRFPPPEDGQR